MSNFLTILVFLSSLSVHAFDHSHAKFTKVLQAYVKPSQFNSKVDYKKLKANPKDLNQYLETLSEVNKKEFDSWSKKDQMAFLINVYNAFTLKLIIDHYPIDSIRDIGGILSKPWKKEFFKVFGKDSYLDQVEHEWLRVWYNEPRIHFAVNCASIGCPALYDKAFTGDKLEKQLSKATRFFLKDKSRNRWNKKDNQLEISSIFKWFPEDFIKSDGSVKAFVVKWMPDLSDKEKKQILSDKVDIEFLDYDWSLNDI